MERTRHHTGTQDQQRAGGGLLGDHQAIRGDPATALAIAAALEEAGLPAGVLNVVFGNAAQISAKLVGSPITRGITFTGSTQIGKQLGALAVQTMKRMTLELGGHAPVVIFGDIDPEAAALSAVTAKFRNSGQVCTSPTRFFVHELIHDRFAAKLSEFANAISIGDGFAASTKMGPLANAAASIRWSVSSRMPVPAR